MTEKEKQEEFVELLLALQQIWPQLDFEDALEQETEKLDKIEKSEATE